MNTEIVLEMVSECHRAEDLCTKPLNKLLTFL